MRLSRHCGTRRVCIALLPLLAACYTYVPMATLEPAAGTRVSLVLNDEGRARAVREVGPLTMRVEGELVQATDADYVLAVTDVVDIRGTRSKWTGETVPLPRSYVMMTYERRLSKPRTIALAAALAGAFAVLVVSRDLLGFGGHANGNGGPPDPNDQ